MPKLFVSFLKNESFTSFFFRGVLVFYIKKTPEGRELLSFVELNRY